MARSPPPEIVIFRTLANTTSFGSTVRAADEEEMWVGDTFELEARIDGSGGSVEAQWTVSDQGVARSMDIHSSRSERWFLLVEALAEGKTRITASYDGRTAALDLIVKERGIRQERSLVDRPDEVSGWQFHPIYMVASDGVDQELDINGWIADTMQMTVDLIAAQTGRRLRVDTYDGEPDVTFVRSEHTEEWFRRCNHVTRCGPSLDVGIDIAGDKVYVVFFGHSIEDESTDFGSGAGYAEVGGADAPGRSTVLLLGPKNFGIGDPLLIAHELFHNLGAVPDCAPHRASGPHVCDGPDLMSYCMPGIEIDFGRDDYYGHDIPGCWDTEDSPLWLDPPGGMPSALRPLLSIPPSARQPVLCRIH